MSKMEIDFTGKVVIVTGASSGIGAETAKMFADYNAKLTIVGRNPRKLAETADECKSRSGHIPLSLLLDLTAEGTCETIIRKTVETYNRLDVLVNCAGKVVLSAFHEQSMEAFDELMNLNLRVPFFLTTLAVPHLQKTKGNIINVGSANSQRFRPGFLPYIVSKSGLERFTKSAAPELALSGIRINTVSPGTTRTNIFRNLNITEDQPEMYNSLVKYMPQGVIIHPKEVATVICWTASDLFPNVIGSNFMIDGASCMS